MFLYSSIKKIIMSISNSHSIDLGVSKPSDVISNSFRVLEHKEHVKECPICLDDIACNTVKTTECNHTFHEECFTTWLTYNNSCPLCRADACVSTNANANANAGANAGIDTEYLDIPIELLTMSDIYLPILYAENDILQEINNILNRMLPIIYEAPPFEVNDVLEIIIEDYYALNN